MRLHPQYGLNPTISVCPLCHKDKNEIALLGNQYKGQAPMHMITSVEPCDTCKQKYLSKGVMMVEASRDSYGRPVPTGNMAVIRDRAFKQLFNNTAIPPKKIAFAEVGLLSRIGALKKNKR